MSHELIEGFYWIIFDDEVGAVREMNIGRDGSPLNLSTYDAVLLTVAPDIGKTPLILNSPCQPDANQILNTGKATYTFVSQPLPAREDPYLAQVTLTNGASKEFFPLDTTDRRAYGRILVRKALS